MTKEMITAIEIDNTETITRGEAGMVGCSMKPLRNELDPIWTMAGKHPGAHH